MSIHADCIQRPDSTYPVVVKPYKLDVSQFGERVRDNMKFTITNVSDQDVTLKMIAGIPDYAYIKLPAKIAAGESASGEIKLVESVLATEFEKSFTFEVDDQAKTRFTVPVKRSVKKPTAGSDAANEAAGG